MATLNELEKKLDTLKNRYKLPEDQRTLTDLERGVKRRIVELEFTDHEIVQKWAEIAREKISEINFILVNDREKNEEFRQRLFTERDTHVFWLARFTGEEITNELSYIEQSVDNKINESQ